MKKGKIKIYQRPVFLKKTAEQTTSLQICGIKKVTPRTVLDKVFETVNFAFMRKIYLLVKKHGKVNFVIFQWRFMSQILPRAHKFGCVCGKI